MNTATTPPGTAPSQGFFRRAATLGFSYVLGTFNDNYYKQAALLLAVSAARDGFQALATLCFALPFVLFSAPAGWLADRYAKKTIVIWAKGIEVLAMLLGAWGMITLNWNCMLGMVFCMGLNSTLFSPALNGSIPELFPEKDVPRVNALFKLTTTVSILLGIVLAGWALDRQLPAWLMDRQLPTWVTAGGWWPAHWNFGQGLVGFGALAVAVAGFASAFAIERRPAAGSRNPFPRGAVVDAFRQWRQLRNDDRSLFTVLWAESFFYFISTMLLLEINRLGVSYMQLSFTMTSLLPVGLMAGICAGSLLAARGTPDSWRALCFPCLLGIGASVAAVALLPMIPAPAQWPAVFALYVAGGLCGGLFLIPLTSFLQVRPAATDKGKVLGIANCMDFTGILLAGQLYAALELLHPLLSHAVMGLLCLATAVGLRLAISHCTTPLSQEN